MNVLSARLCGGSLRPSFTKTSMATNLIRSYASQPVQRNVSLLSNSLGRPLFKPNNVMAKFDLTKVAKRTLFTQSKSAVKDVSSFKQTLKLGQSKVFQRFYGSSFSKVSKSRPGETVWRFLGIGASACIIAIAFNGLREGLSGTNTYSDSVSKRISTTYGYVVLGLGLTAATAVACVKQPAVLGAMSSHPIMFSIGTSVLSIGCIMIARSSDSPAVQHAALFAFNALFGVTLCPIMMISGAIVQQAAIGTGIIVGSISLIAATTRSDNHLAMAGPLTVGLGVLVAASIGNIFLPASPILYNIVTYGGLLVFGGFTYYDTQRMIHKAKTQYDYNPLQTSISIYLDVVNIFIRMVSIMSSMGNRKK